MTKLKSPCELVVWYVLPNVRAELAKNLIKKGLTRKDVAKRLGLTESAVSQYVKGKRGKNLTLPGEISREIEKLADDMVQDNEFNDVVYRICEICSIIKLNLTLCIPHIKSNMIPRSCDACVKLYAQ